MSRNQSRNPIQRLLETEEKGRGLALFGWAGVTVFAFLAAFASWQFAPTRATSRMARLDDVNVGDITGGIKPATRTAAVSGRVPTVPTPLPGDPSISKEDFDQLKADLRDLRRVIGRIDVSTDVLARRISNLEESVGTGQMAAEKPQAKPLQALTPINPPAQLPPAAAPVAAGPAMIPPPVVASTQPLPAPSSPPAAAPSPMPMPAPIAGAPQSVTVVPQTLAQTPHPLIPPPRPPAAPDNQAPKSSFDRTAVDRTTLERMLMQRAQGLDPDGGTEANTYIPPLPDPISVVPKSRPPMVMLPQPLASVEPKPPSITNTPAAVTEPVPDVATTGSLQQKPVLPIDPTKAVPVIRPAPVVEAAKPSPAAPEMSPDEQKKASEKMALAMRDGQATAPVQKPAEPIGIDLGAYKSIGQVKKVWADLELRQGKLAKALTPLASLGETTDGVEIRLVAGPFVDKEQAMRTCRQIRGATAKCDPVAYAGESILTKPAPEIEHRPTTDLEHKPAVPNVVVRPPLKLDLPKQTVAPPITP